MSLNIKTEDTHRRSREPVRLVARLLAIGHECAALPVFDKRRPDSMLYDKRGLPK
jgi:hypothetical protein